MSPPRRRSARLASTSAVKKRATPELGSVAEGDETPSRTTCRRADADTDADASMRSPWPEPSTPASSALKPPRSEMHPSKFQSSTGAPSSALRLGFSDIPKEGRTPRGQDGTPSKVQCPPNSAFTFRIARDAADTELSGGAQRMLDEIRDQAAKIKAELVAQREADSGGCIADRQIAKPRGKVGRFSAAHIAEFKKMDSIEGHASAWRAQDGRFTPVKSLKRTPSKANFDATPTSQRTDGVARSGGKTGPEEPPIAQPKPSLKRKSSAANLDGDRDHRSDVKKRNANPTPGKFSTAARAPPTSGVKRVKQRQEDDASTTRPTSSHNASPSKSNSIFSRLASPKKAPVAPSPAVAKPAFKSTVSLVHSPSKSSLHSLSKSASTSSLTSTTSKAIDLKRRIISPRSFSKVKSILGGNKSALEDGISAIPAPQVSQTPDAPRVNKELPPIPLTTPRRKLTKRVTFTPDVVTAVNAQNSPSPQRLGNFKLRPALKTIETHYPALDDVLTQSSAEHSLYPDLSPLKHLIDTQSRRAVSVSPSRPGTFTFRSDHTIEFGDAPSSGFGASPGQSSVRHVSGPVGASNMPGSFPAAVSPSSHPNKENTAPSPMKLLSGTAHGMQNKKRHRATSDEDDFDNNRASKKRKNENVPEGQELLAPRFVKSGSTSATKTSRFARTPSKTLTNRTPGRTPVRAPASANSAKKTGGLSMSRLNMLARPKNRA
ncbi:hypothetical protein QQS21_007333 [Conoideocrella luteorostrata]|uniref:Erythromycin esterase n=1 Tax=Conoideocrella luteorostrata TaxID=1105319 RepID=A0AAJ0FZJ2_9HYPO|nr:hypothetical protein QQS21_007333 [Conoideocrella luteorostrata]